LASSRFPVTRDVNFPHRPLAAVFANNLLDEADKGTPQRLASEPHTRLRYFCSPQHTDSAFYPIIWQMERAAGLAHDDTAQAKLDKLDALFAQTSTTKPDAALFAKMLSLLNDGRYPALDLAPQQRRRRTLEALTSQLAGLASQHPVLMIFEDVHWIDPTSLEALGRAMDRIKVLPALLIVTFRPEFNAAKVANKDTQTVVSALIKQAKTLPNELYKSLTWDRGKELADHRRFTLATNIEVYFCDPQSPWQRGSNENTNGLLRQYFPKGTDLSVYSQAHLNKVARQLNETNALGNLPKRKG
jgi:hypothetical protein